MNTYSTENLVCLVLEHALEQNELYFVGTYYEEEHYFMRAKIFYDARPLSAETLSKLFGKEHSLYFTLNVSQFNFGVLYLKWLDDVQCYIAKLNGDTWRLSDNSNMGVAYKESDDAFANFFNRLHPLIQREAQTIESIIFKMANKHRFSEVEAQNIFKVIQEKELYTPFSLNNEVLDLF